MMTTLKFSKLMQSLDLIIRRIRQAFGVPVCLISLVLEDVKHYRFYTDPSIGLKQTDKMEREALFYQQAIQPKEPLVIMDTELDPRFQEVYLVKDHNVRFFAGTSLLHEQGYVLGTLCILDDKPHSFSKKDMHLLNMFCQEAMSEITMLQKQILSVESSERIVSSIIQSAHDAIIITDSKMNILSWNKAAELIFDYTEGEWKGKSLHSIFLNIKCIQENVEETVSCRTVKLNGVKKGGTLFPVEMSWSKGKADEIVYFGLIVRDITERNKEEKILRESKARLQSIVEYAGIGIAVLDMDGRTVECNKTLSDFLGYDKNELLQISVSDLTHPDDLLKDYNLFHELVAHKRETYHIEKRYFHKDGPIVWGHLTLSLIHDEDGNPLYAIAMVDDITERKRVEEEIRVSEERYRLLLELSPGGIIVHDGVSILYINPSGKKTLGIPEETEVIGQLILPILHPSFGLEINPINKDGNQPKMPEMKEMKFLCCNGEAIDVEVTEQTVQFEGKQAQLMNFKNITEQKRAIQTINYLAYHDTVTGLPNRSFFNERLQTEIKAFKKTSKDFAVMFMDLDRFKTINDTLGHNIGDKLLKMVAQRLQEYSESSYVLCRWGGDEFALILSDIENQKSVAAIASHIIKSFNSPFVVEKNELYVSTSAGIALYPSDGDTSEKLIKNADTAMYRAKEQGRNNYQFYSNDMFIVASDKRNLENSLRKALEMENFILYYQPKIHLLTQQIIGVEALIRWNHPTKGIINPVEFIPMAEELGLIHPIGEWVLRTACRQNKSWHDSGLKPIRVAVNLSPVQFQHEDFWGMISSILEETGLDAKWLEIEITESAIIKNEKKAFDIILKLKQLGVRILIDNFGTGYSSFSFLRTFPFDEIKIDRTFLKNVMVNEKDAAIVKMLISLSNHLKLKITAEGVETEEQLNFLRTENCHYYQGYIFSKPLPVDELSKLFQVYRVV